MSSSDRQHNCDSFVWRFRVSMGSQSAQAALDSETIVTAEDVIEMEIQLARLRAEMDRLEREIRDLEKLAATQKARPAARRPRTQGPKPERRPRG